MVGVLPVPFRISLYSRPLGNFTTPSSFSFSAKKRSPFSSVPARTTTTLVDENRKNANVITERTSWYIFVVVVVLDWLYRGCCMKVSERRSSIIMHRRKEAARKQRLPTADQPEEQSKQ